MRVVSWNVNSIRARLDHLVHVLDRHDPDVLLLQETRCTDAAFPHALLANRGFECAHHGLDHRNGVAIASRVGLGDIRYGFLEAPPSPFDEARLVAATCGGVRMHSVYVPNGRTLDDAQYTYKLAWLEQLRSDLAETLLLEQGGGPPVLVAGDFNVAPADIDIYDPSRFRRTTHASPPERAALGALKSLGLVDTMRAYDPRPERYTWWSHAPGQVSKNRGMRIDLAFSSPSLAARVERVEADRETRELPRASDHAPVIIDITNITN